MMVPKLELLQLERKDFPPGSGSRKDRCETCQYWCCVESECRIHPPSLFLANESGFGPISIWPKTEPNNFCGDHRIDEDIEREINSKAEKELKDKAARKILPESIASLNLKTRALMDLMRVFGDITVEELCKKNASQLKEVPGIGPGNLDCLKKILENYGLSLADEQKKENH